MRERGSGRVYANPGTVYGRVGTRQSNDTGHDAAAFFCFQFHARRHGAADVTVTRPRDVKLKGLDSREDESGEQKYRVQVPVSVGTVRSPQHPTSPTLKARGLT